VVITCCCCVRNRPFCANHRDGGDQ
jgi:hypothetical protein